MLQPGQQQQPKALTLDLEFINEVIGYLSTQPYNQVFRLIAKLHQTAQEQLGQQLTGGDGGKTNATE